MTVGTGNIDQETKQLQALAIVCMAGYLCTALADGILVGLFTLTFGLFEQPAQNLVALLHGNLAKVMAKHGAHELHLRVHDPAVGLDYIRGQHQH